MHARRASARTIAMLRLGRAFGAALALLCVVGPVAAQVASLRVYGTADGLRSLGADCLVEDPQANVYACTYGGLYRYEGERFERVGAGAGLDDAYVMNASPAPDGRGLWVATAANLYFWDGDRAVRVLDPAGSPLPFEVGHNVAALADGAVALFVRPQDLQPVAPGQGGWQAQVESVQRSGPRQRIHARLDDGTPLELELPAATESVQVGERVGLVPARWGAFAER